LLRNPAILFLKNIIKSVKIMLILTFKAPPPPTHMYISIIHTKCFNALAGIQAVIIYTTIQQSRKATVYHSGRDNQGRCVQGHKKHNCNTNEGCTYQGQNNQGLNFTGIAINSWDVFFKDRFMLAPTRRRYNEIHFTPIHPNFRQVKDKLQLKVLKKQIVWESLMTCCKERVTPKVQKRGLQHEIFAPINGGAKRVAMGL
jgi:hypothetical protein